jgi:hypothetical protein
VTKWDILIASLCSRTDRLERLLTALLKQVDDTDGQVHVTVYRNQGERPLAEIRQALIGYSHAEYGSFIDDDDAVPDDFVATILPLLDGVDTVNWRMQVYFDGVAQKPTYHGLSYGGWSEDANGYYRDVSHLNPFRMELARQCDFRREVPPEDWAWVQQMQRLVKTEHVVPYDKVMYHYFHSTGDSKWVPGSVIPLGRQLPILRMPDSPNLFIHPRSTC